MLGKEIFDFHSQGVGDVYINSFLIFAQRRYLLFSEATSAREDLTKSHALLKDTSQWYNNHLPKLNIQKTQFSIILLQESKRLLTLDIFQKTNIESQLSINVLGIAPHTDLSFHTHAFDFATRATNKSILFKM